MTTLPPATPDIAALLALGTGVAACAVIGAGIALVRLMQLAGPRTTAVIDRAAAAFLLVTVGIPAICAAIDGLFALFGLLIRALGGQV